ncbi:diguanylate cyclase [Pandoraea aquatica]|uniref:diguanylate cyclase n=1 Tax=Pandoraea aquatica TaxID=2508290 RepID=A0A5E4SMB2_9BURK|nr:diguanylate cyclase [Pandoraea aquatica]
MAEQLRRDIERLHIDHAGSTAGTVTVSVGAATGRVAECDSAEAILKAAGEQLRLAKQNGRNRVSAVVLRTKTRGGGGDSGGGGERQL